VVSEVVYFNWNTSSLQNGRYKVRAIAVENGHDIFGYHVYRRSIQDTSWQLIKETTETSYTYGPINPYNTYAYKVEAFDSYGNASMSSEAQSIPEPNDVYNPIADAGGDQTGIIGMEIAFDGTQSKDNDRIAGYTWNFGDGSTANIAQPNHIYTQEGTYIITLTVTDTAGNRSVDTVKIVVYPQQTVGTLAVRVIDDETGETIANADVYANFMDDRNPHFVTNESGLAYVISHEGRYNISAYKNGYMPSQVNVEIIKNQKSDITIRLKKGQLVVGDIKVRRMPIDEIINEGIDVTAPENQFMYNFEVHLAFNKESLLPVYIVANGHGTIYMGGGVGGSSWRAYLQAISHQNHPEVPPTIAFLIIPGQTSWLKELFEVGLVLQNMAEPQFAITNSKATLNLPDGLTLAPTREKQSLTVDIGSIAGGESREVKWIIRGDKKGEYNLEADFSGTLMPFNAPIQTSFITKDPVKVWGSDALHLYVEAEDWAFVGEDYYVYIGLKNVSDAPIYNATLNVAGASGKNYTIDVENSNIPLTLSDGDSLQISVLMPGQTIWVDYCTKPNFEGKQGDSYRLDLSKSFAINLFGGELEIPITFISIPSVRKQYHQKVIDLSYWADPVDTATGAQVINKSLLNVNGLHQLSFGISYNSRLLDESCVGKGWNYNFDIHLEKVSDSNVKVFWAASYFNKYYKDSENHFRPVDMSTRLDSMVKNEDGSYTLTRGDKSIYQFDALGHIISITNRNGQQIVFEHNEDGKLVVIKELATEQTINISYNTQGLIESVTDKLGRSVELSYNDKNYLIAIKDGNGKITSYTYDNEGHVLTGTSADGTLIISNTYDSLGRVLTQDDGVQGNGLTIFEYDEITQPDRIFTKITDRNGNKRVNVHNRKNQLIQVIDELGNVTDFEYSTCGKILKKIDAERNIEVHEYDERGNLIASTDKEGMKTIMTYDSNDNLLSVENTKGYKVIYTYDENNNVLSSIDQLGNEIRYTYNKDGQPLTKIVEGIGTVTFTYGKGKLKSMTDPEGNTVLYEYDLAGRLVSTVDGEENKTTYVYDEVDNLTSIIDPFGNSVSYNYDSNHNKISEKDKNSNVTIYKYNGNGKLMEKADALGNITEYIYDGEGRIINVKDAEGNLSIVEYDATGRVIKSTNAEGSSISYTYDKIGNVLTKTESGKGTIKYSYYKNGKLKTITDASENTTTYIYDSLWRLVEVTNAAGKSTKYEYDEANRLIDETDPLGNRVSYTYDVLGNKTSRIDAKGNTTKYNYNGSGKLAEIIDALGNRTRYEYDREGRVVKTIDARDNATTFIYDALGRVKEIRDTLGHTVTMEYDAVGNLIIKRDVMNKAIMTATYDATGNPLTTKDALGNVITNYYDKLGRLVEIVDALNRSTKYNYDKANRLICVTDALEGQSKQRFDENGNLQALIDANNNESVFNYDEAGRLISEITAIDSMKTYGYNSLNLLSESKNGREQTTTYEYDDAGRLKSFTDNEGNVSYTYDANGNILTVTDAEGTIIREYDALNRVIKYTDAKGNTIRYVYDEVGNLVKLTYPDGKEVSYEYNAVNQLVKVKDWTNRITSYEYDVDGRLIKATRPNGTVLTAVYDDAGRVTQYKDVDRNGKVINQYDYNYDSVGNVIAEQSSYKGKNPNVKDTELIYDKGNRLISYNGQNVEYDEDGNMIYGPLNGKMVAFTYDSRNRLISAGNTTYEYDAENNRIAVVEDGKRTEYVINPNAELSQVLIKKDGSKTFYVYGLGLISQEGSKGSYKLYHFDRRGSTTAITDMNGVVTDRFEYEPYGKLISRTGTTQTPFLYNGKYGVMTDSNGLYYMRARYYSPELMRFINQDALQGNITDGRTLNRYAYANGNPVSNIDPFGLSAESDSKVKSGIRAVLDIVTGGLQVLAGIELIAFGAATGGIGFVALGGLGLLNIVHGANRGLSGYNDVYALATGEDELVGSFNLLQSGYRDVLGDKYGTIAYNAVDIGIDIADIGVGWKIARSARGRNVGVERAAKAAEGTPTKTLYHYTNEEGLNGILESNELRPSLKANNLKGARYGNGQYLSDIVPETTKPTSLASKFIRVPNKYKYTHFVEIDVTGLEVVEGRSGVYVIPNEGNLDITGRIVRSGKVGN